MNLTCILVVWKTLRIYATCYKIWFHKLIYDAITEATTNDTTSIKQRNQKKNMVHIKK